MATREARVLERQAEAALGRPTLLAELAARLRPALAPALSILALLALWQVAALVANNPRRLPSPAAVLAMLVELTVSGELLYHLGVTLARVAASFVIAMALGTALGVLMGRSALVD